MPFELTKLIRRYAGGTGVAGEGACAPGLLYNNPMNKDPRYWHSRGYLPHFDADGFTQFITFRLADSIPQTVLEKGRAELKSNAINDADFRRRIEFYLDQNYAGDP